MYETLVSRALCVQTRATWRRAVRPCTPTLSSSATPTCCVTKSPATSLPPLADLPVSTLRKDLQARGAVHYQHQNPLDNHKRKSTINAYVNIKMTSPPAPSSAFYIHVLICRSFWFGRIAFIGCRKGARGWGHTLIVYIQPVLGWMDISFDDVELHVLGCRLTYRNMLIPVPKHGSI